MTDKVQKIKEWISKTQDGLMDANGNFEYLEHEGAFHILTNLDYYIDSLQEEPDPYIQYASRESAIKAHAEDYSWNIESELFQQLTPEQQKLWRKEIEQACISGGYSGLTLAKDRRYDNTPKMKEVDLEKELESWRHNHFHGRRDKEASGEYFERVSQLELARHFFELGLSISNKVEKDVEEKPHVIWVR